MSYYVHSWQGLYFSFSLSLFFFKNLIVLYTLPIYGYQYILVPYQNTKEWLKKRTQMHMHLTLRSLRRRFFFKNLIILYTLPIYGYQYILVPYQNTKEGLKKRTQMHMHLTLIPSPCLWVIEIGCRLVQIWVVLDNIRGVWYDPWCVEDFNIVTY